ALYVSQVPGELLPDRPITLVGVVTAVLLDRLVHPLAEVVVGPVAAGIAHDVVGRRKLALHRQAEQGGYELARGQVACRAEDHDRHGFDGPPNSRPVTQWVISWRAVWHHGLSLVVVHSAGTPSTQQAGHPARCAARAPGSLHHCPGWR